MSPTRLVIVQFSESFAQVWDDLAGDLGVTCDIIGSEDPIRSSADVAALLLAAGGTESALIEWLDRHDTPPNVPT